MRRRRAICGLRIFTLSLGLAAVAYALSDHPLYCGGAGFGATEAIVASVGVALAFATTRRPAINAKILVAVLGALASLALAEAVLESMLAPRYRPPFVHHPRYLFTLQPNRVSEHRRAAINGGDRIVSKTNADGFRGPPLQPRGQTPRIVVYGDSFIHAPYCRLQHTFTERLEHELGTATDQSVEVINAGVSSYGPDQALLRIEDELVTLTPDLVIVAIFAGNDFGDLLRNKLFRVDADDRLVANQPRLAPALRRGFELSARESIVKRAFRAALEGPGDAAQPGRPPDEPTDPDLALMKRWLAQAQREHVRYVLDGDDVVTNVYNDPYSADVSLVPQTDAARYRVRLMDAIVRRIADRTAQRSIPLVLLLIPHPIDVAPGYGPGRVDRDRFASYAPTNLTDALQRIADRHDLRAVNLFATFAATDANALYFHGGDDHWNEAGQALAARVMAEYVLRQRLLDAPAHPPDER